MKILVGIKHVPDTETKVKVAGDGRSLDEGAVNKWVISPYDEYALEAALQLRDAAGSGEVIAVCAGREAGQASLRQALATGADRAVMIADERLERSDALARSRVLAAVAQRETADLVLFGKYGVGTDEGLTGPMVAELLGRPHVAGILSLEVADGRYRATREIEGAVETHEGALPAVLTCDKGLNKPRYPSLKGIMMAKKKPVDTLTVAELGVDDASLDAPALTWESMRLPEARGAGRIIEGTPAEAAAELVRLLHEEKKVI